MSQAPRPMRRPSSLAQRPGIAGPGLALDRHHVGVAAEHDPAGDRGPDQRESPALVPVGSGTRRLATPSSASQASTKSTRSEVRLLETVGNATRRASISRGEGRGGHDRSFGDRRPICGPAGQRQPEVSRLSPWIFCCLVAAKRPAARAARQGAAAAVPGGHECLTDPRRSSRSPTCGRCSRPATGRCTRSTASASRSAPGELLGVVGESGSGKSVTMMSLMGLLPSPPAEVVGGSILYQGREVRDMSAARAARAPRRRDRLRLPGPDDQRSIRSSPSATSWSSRSGCTCGFEGGGAGSGGRAARRWSASRMPRRRLDDYPHQFSGGMRQRVMIAMALACDPKLLIADEPTTALDVTIQAQILEIVRELRQRLGMGIVWITHDLGLVAGIADRVMVMYAGLVVEHGPVGEHLRAARSTPTPGRCSQTVPSVTGDARAAAADHRGPAAGDDGRAARPARSRRAAAHVFNRCRVENPPRIPVGPGHDAACWWDADDRGAAPCRLSRGRRRSLRVARAEDVLSRSTGACCGGRPGRSRRSTT